MNTISKHGIISTGSSFLNAAYWSTATPITESTSYGSHNYGSITSVSNRNANSLVCMVGVNSQAGLTFVLFKKTLFLSFVLK